MTNKKEKITIWILFLLFAALFVASFDSGDIDDVCNTNGATLQRINGTWSCSITHYGELYYHHDSDPMVRTFASAGNWTQLTGLNISNCRGITCSTNDFTLAKNATYQIDNSMSFTGGANSIYHCSIFLNGIEQVDCEFQRTMSGTATIGVATFTCLKSGLTDATIDIRCKDDKAPVSSMNIYATNTNVVEIK